MLGRPLFRWMLAATALVVAMLGGREARANAPMCDVRGASVYAPPLALAVDDGAIDALDASTEGCATLLVMTSASADGPEAQSPAAAMGSPDPALTLGVLAAPRDAGERAHFVATTIASPRDAVADGLFRPPKR